VTRSARDIGRIEKKYFHRSVTPRERAIFEAGIALGALTHQFTGTPISTDEKTVRSLEDAISRVGRLQPYRFNVEAKINRTMLRGKEHPYDYGALSENQLELSVETRFKGARARARMHFLPELQYPLMYLEDVSG
jgi:hypothetical protein